MPLLQKQDLEHRQRRIAWHSITNMQTRYALQVVQPASIIAQVAENHSLDAETHHGAGVVVVAQHSR